ncbi:SDR family oxidoreductase [Cnuibacter physcomitrellae]|uniref:SDR family NAD(P)-dependent oxidoreductase n=1 Tax=Cnuibacter physcomitrellae TaxID=1619308 RepID=UPI0021760AA6|nr:SDR family oxidoreductase [Cnuibacter physcomitrellae]MCS5497846.1 SDR family oxidoreductase [Cnuibacter physcomitrellae]
MIDLTGRIAVVTGGAQGIGAATVTRLAEAGATTIVADRRLEPAQELAATLGDRVHARPVDVSDSSSVRDLVQSVVADFGGLDAWVNNAGIVEDSRALDMPDEVWQRTVDVDLTGTFFGAREAGRHMTAHGGGAIVNISSIAAYRATRPEHHVAYDVSKAAVAHMATVLASEWASAGVRVNAVAPGYTNTEILKGVGSADPEVMAAWIAQVPQGRLIEPVEIANVVVFLVSDLASSITGQVVHADAGYTAW